MNSTVCTPLNRLLVAVCLCFVYISSAKAVQYAIESDVTARAEYDDNIFITTLPHDSVYGLTVIPQARLVAREANWETFLNGRLRSNNYSDSNLDSNDIYLDASGSFTQQRNVFSLAGQYNLDSNLNTLSSDFGISGQRINRELWSITPEYQRLLTERTVLALSYSHIDVDYLDAEGTDFRPYELDIGSGSIAYQLTERDKLSFILQATDYRSKDEILEYQLFIARVGIEHEFTERWSADFAIGGSRTDSTIRITQTVDFLGEPLTLTEEQDFSDNGYVLDAGFTRQLETGEFSGRISRENVPNATGGLDEVDRLIFRLAQRMTARWRYAIGVRYEDIDGIADLTRSTDREILFFEPKVFYEINRQWTASASYRYIQRQFKDDISESTPHSNRIFIGMTYNFPDISTF